MRRIILVPCNKIFDTDFVTPSRHGMHGHAIILMIKIGLNSRMEKNDVLTNSNPTKTWARTSDRYYATEFKNEIVPSSGNGKSKFVIEISHKPSRFK